MSENHQLVEKKLLLLYLVDKMEIPITNNQISQFILEEDMMSYFTLQQCLEEMSRSNLLDKVQTNNTTSYTINDSGLEILSLFIKKVPSNLRTRINNYVEETMEAVKKDYEVISNYFYDHNCNEYIVKCGAYDNDTILIEINISVVTKEQAKIICQNWKENVHMLYPNILQSLMNTEND